MTKNRCYAYLQFLVQILILNSYILWKKVKTVNEFTYLLYRKILCSELLYQGKIEIEEACIGNVPNSVVYKRKEYFEKTFLHDLIKGNEWKRCKNCKEESAEKKTKYCCKQCNGFYHRKILEEAKNKSLIVNMNVFLYFN